MKMIQYHELMNPALEGLHALGGSGSNDEIYEKVVELLNLPNDLLEQVHDPSRGNMSEVEYRLAWAKNYLKNYGLIENSSRGVWALVNASEPVTRVEPCVVVSVVQAGLKARKITSTSSRDKPVVDKRELDEPPTEILNEVQSNELEEQWRVDLQNILTNTLSPAQFERLVQRLLRECGFVHVEVTGASNDGGIDGKGILRLGGIMSFHVLFQCKKYTGVVSSDKIRDFRGALVGRADKGLFVTTGSFTRDAMKEATRDGAPPIDLIDGDQLADMLKNLGLGVEKKIVERFEVNKNWFEKI